MKKILTSLLLLACCATVGQAQMPVTVQRQLPTVIEQFNQEKPFLNHAYWYVLTDVDSDGFNEFAITDFEKQFTSTFKITNEKLERIRTIPSGNVDWKPIFYIYSTEGRNANLDVTLKHRPLFLNKIQIAKNRFSTNNGTWMTEGVDVGKMKRIYDRIIFKPHIGNAKFVNEKSVGGWLQRLSGHTIHRAKGLAQRSQCAQLHPLAQWRERKSSLTRCVRHHKPVLRWSQGDCQ